MNTEAPNDTRTLDAGETLWLDGQIAEIMDGVMVDQKQTPFGVHELIGLGSLQGNGAESYCASRKSTVKIWPREAFEAMTKRLAQEVERLQHEARQQQFASSEQGLMSDRRHRDRFGRTARPVPRQARRQTPRLDRETQPRGVLQPHPPGRSHRRPPPPNPAVYPAQPVHPLAKIGVQVPAVGLPCPD